MAARFIWVIFQVPALGQSKLQTTDKDSQKRGEGRSEEKIGESIMRVVQVDWASGEDKSRILSYGDDMSLHLQVMRKVEVCVRHVPQVTSPSFQFVTAFSQVLLRGEHVVMVAAALPS